MKSFNRYFASAMILLVLAIIFIIVAINHPELSFQWDNKFTYLLYALYFIITIILFVLGVKKNS